MEWELRAWQRGATGKESGEKREKKQPPHGREQGNPKRKRVASGTRHASGA